METYDWRKGREWIDYKYRRDKDDKRLWRGVCWKGSLEPTHEEAAWWERFFEEEVEAYDTKISQTLPFLAHPRVGKIVSLTSLKRVAFLEQNRFWSIKDSSFESKRITWEPIELSEDPQVIERWSLYNGVVKNIAQRVLQGEIPSQEELRASYIDYLHKSEPQRETHDSVAWHRMIQHNGDIQALPYLGLISDEEMKIAINAYFEEKYGIEAKT